MCEIDICHTHTPLEFFEALMAHGAVKKVVTSDNGTITATVVIPPAASA